MKFWGFKILLQNANKKFLSTLNNFQINQSENPSIDLWDFKVYQNVHFWGPIEMAGIYILEIQPPYGGLLSSSCRGTLWFEKPVLGHVLKHSLKPEPEHVRGLGWIRVTLVSAKKMLVLVFGSHLDPRSQIQKDFCCWWVEVVSAKTHFWNFWNFYKCKLFNFG